MRLALDTNLLVYAEGINDPDRNASAVALLRKIPPASVCVPLHALAELFYVLVRKANLKPSDARNVILSWKDQYAVIETSDSVLLSAMELASQHRLRIFDAIILAAAASARCRLLLSEDLQDGFTWNGVTVVNPFAKTPNDLLTEALNQ